MYLTGLEKTQYKIYDLKSFGYNELSNCDNIGHKLLSWSIPEKTTWYMMITITPKNQTELNIIGKLTGLGVMLLINTIEQKSVFNARVGNWNIWTEQKDYRKIPVDYNVDFSSK